MFTQSIPVLMYHHVLPKPGPVAIQVGQFEAHLRYLNEYGWHTLSAEAFRRFKTGEAKVPRKSVLLTFDDGWLDNYLYALPLLQKYQCKAVMFIVSDWVARASQSAPVQTLDWENHAQAKALTANDPARAVMHWEQLGEVLDSGLVDLACHTHTHPDRAQQNVDLRAELEQSQAFFQTQLGARSRHLCYPYGQHWPGDEQIAAQCGFDVCYTVDNGANTADGRLTEIQRFSVKDRPADWLGWKLWLFANAPLAAGYGRWKSR